MPGPIAPAGLVDMGQMICSQLRINPSTDDLAVRVFGDRAVWMYPYVTPQAVDAARRELCPDTLQAGFVPGQTDEARYLAAAGPMPGPVAQAGIIQMGHAICDQLRINPSHDDLGPRVFGRAFWIYNYLSPQAVSAAQHELCPDTLGAGS